jgi:hypothetical protein
MDQNKTTAKAKAEEVTKKDKQMTANFSGHTTDMP